VGPGDAEEGLDEAKKAMTLSPDYPPNAFALAEALAATKDRDGARDAYARGKALAVARRDRLDPDAPFWIVEADKALAKLKQSPR
jgi:hypothetical protein